MTGPEIERLSGAVRFMGKYCQPGRLWWLSTDKGTTRSVVADIEKRITRLQLACDLPQHRVTVFEGSGGLHAHLIFTGTREIARRLEGSMAFGNIVEVKPVDGLRGHPCPRASWHPHRVNRIVRIREWRPDLFGRAQNRWRVIRAEVVRLEV